MEQQAIDRLLVVLHPAIGRVGAAGVTRNVAAARPDDRVTRHTIAVARGSNREQSLVLANRDLARHTRARWRPRPSRLPVGDELHP